jgi:hypothetical protein
LTNPSSHPSILAMKQKLTLTISPEAVETLKRVAKKRGIYVSSMVEEWSKDLEPQDDRPKFGEKFRGAWKSDNMPTVPSGDDHLDYLLEKHCK